MEIVRTTKRGAAPTKELCLVELPIVHNGLHKISTGL